MDPQEHVGRLLKLIIIIGTRNMLDYFRQQLHCTNLGELEETV